MRLAMGLSLFGTLAFGFGGGGFRAGDASGPPAQFATPTVPYSVVEQWSIEPAANAGYGRVVVVDPAQRSEAGLIALAEQLQRDSGADRGAVVYIYDDPTAAKMRKDAGNEQLSYADGKWHDDHMIGIFTKILRAGQPPVFVRMTLQGANGPSKEVALP